MLDLLMWPTLAVLAFVVILLISRVFVRRAIGAPMAEALRATGIPARAVVIDTYDTGNRVWASFILTRLTLRVQAPEGDFDAVVTAPISPVKMAEFAPGREINVRFDPATRAVAVDQPQR